VISDISNKNIGFQITITAISMRWTQKAVCIVSVQVYSKTHGFLNREVWCRILYFDHVVGIFLNGYSKSFKTEVLVVYKKPHGFAKGTKTKKNLPPKIYCTEVKPCAIHVFWV
jgi:hypothetical protein